MTSQLVLLSGGVDSAACLALAMHGRARVEALHVCYPHPARDAEDLSARALALHSGVLLTTIDAWMPLVGIAAPCPRCGASGQSPCHDAASYGATHRDRKELDPVLPGRNAILLAAASAHAADRGLDEVVIGMTAADWRFRDCSKSWLRMWNAQATEAGLPPTVAPLHGRTREYARRILRRFDVPAELLSSCYVGSRCGVCISCQQDRDDR